MKVRNASKVVVGLCAFAKDSTRMIDRVSIEPGAEVEVEDRFLETEGAKGFLKSGRLERVVQMKAQAESDSEADSEQKKRRGGSR